MVLCRAVFLMLVKYAWVENSLYAFVYEPLHMTVSKLCGIAFRLGRNRIHSELINFSARKRRQYDSESELLEKYSPERIIFVHIQYARNTYYTSRSIAFGKWLVIEQTLALVFKHIRRFFCRSDVAETFFTAISRNVRAPLRKLVDSEHTVVCTTAASAACRGICKRYNIVNGEH